MENNFTLIIACLGLLISLIVGFAQVFHSRASTRKIEHEIFNHYNKSFESISQELDAVLSSSDTMTPQQIRIIKNYINLCSEEYYWKQKKAISKIIWDSWYIGMEEYFENYKFKQVIKDQTKYAKSYYGFYNLTLIQNILNSH